MTIKALWRRPVSLTIEYVGLTKDPTLVEYKVIATSEAVFYFPPPHLIKRQAGRAGLEDYRQVSNRDVTGKSPLIRKELVFQIRPQSRKEVREKFLELLKELTK